MGAMSELAIGIVEVVYPNDDAKQDEMLAACRFVRFGSEGECEHTPQAIRTFYEQHGAWPRLDVEKACEMIKEFEQPEPVCICGRTSSGRCPRCGQNMDFHNLRNPAYDGPDGIFTDYTGPDNPNKETT